MCKPVNKVVVCFFALLLSLLFFICLFPIFKIANSQLNDEETLIQTVVSPNEEYVLEAYRTEPGATIDFSIRVYLVENDNKELIYDVYHEYDVEIEWINNSQVSINGKIINLK